MTRFLFVVIALVLWGPVFLWSATTGQPIQVLVNIQPYKFLVERIGGNTVKVQVLIPPNVNMHTYEPTAKQALEVAKSDVWFLFGESIEKRLRNSLTSNNPNLKVVDLRRNLTLVGAGCKGCCSSSGQDIHIWMSARLLQQQAKTVAEALSAINPDHAAVYQANLTKHLAELKQLEQGMTSILKPVEGRTVLVTHPDYTYFCIDYGLHQLPIEFEGKDPSPRQLTDLLANARKLGIKAVFTTSQYPIKVATLVAGQIGAQVVMLDPFKENYLENLLTIAQSFVRHTPR